MTKEEKIVKEWEAFRLRLYLLGYAKFTRALKKQIEPIIASLEGTQQIVLINAMSTELITTLPISTFNLTRLALVVETSITYNHSRFLTEKTFKPLVSGQPFVIYGAHNHLKNLRDHYGFRTYHELWDEGYDELWDHTARANAIIDLLNSLEHFDWKAAEPKLKEIANHNFRNILHLRDIYSNESINELDNIYNFVYNTV